MIFTKKNTSFLKFLEDLVWDLFDENQFCCICEYHLGSIRAKHCQTIGPFFLAEDRLKPQEGKSMHVFPSGYSSISCQDIHGPKSK